MHTYSGKVIHGRGQGNKLGFPTVNLTTELSLKDARAGVYAGYVSVDNTTHKAAIIIIPTHLSCKRIECHILHYNKDIYDKEITATLRVFVRPLEKYKTKDSFVRAVKNDIQNIDKILTEQKF